MKILIDTNVLIDYLIAREPYIESAKKIMRLCADKKVQGFMAAHSIPNIFFILRKEVPINNVMKQAEKLNIEVEVKKK